jgi:hypothetical protein
MAQTLQGLNKPARLTLSGTTVNLITIPDGTDYLAVHPIDTDAYLTIGVADAASKGSHYITLVAGVINPITVGHLGAGLLGISGTASAVVEVWPMSAGR